MKEVTLLEVDCPLTGHAWHITFSKCPPVSDNITLRCLEWDRKPALGIPEDGDALVLIGISVIMKSVLGRGWSSVTLLVFLQPTQGISSRVLGM